MVRPGRLRRRRPSRQFRQRAVHFHRGSVHPDVLDSVQELGRNLVRLHQLQERALWIGGRHNGLRLDGAPAREEDSRDPPILAPDPFDGGLQEDLDTVCSGGSRERVRQGAHPADHESPGADLPFEVPEEVVRERERRSGGGWSREVTDHALVREGRLHLVGLEVLIEQLFRAVEQEAPHEILRPRALQERDEIGDGHRRRKEHRLDKIVHVRPHRFVFRIPGGVLLRELRDFLRGLLVVVPEEEMPSVGKRAESLGVEGDLPQSKLRQLEITLNPWAISSVTHAPPTRSERSVTTTRSPAFAR